MHTNARAPRSCTLTLVDRLSNERIWPQRLGSAVCGCLHSQVCVCVCCVLVCDSCAFLALGPLSSATTVKSRSCTRSCPRPRSPTRRSLGAGWLCCVLERLARLIAFSPCRHTGNVIIDSSGTLRYPITSSYGNALSNAPMSPQEEKKKDKEEVPTIACAFSLRGNWRGVFVVACVSGRARFCVCLFVCCACHRASPVFLRLGSHQENLQTGQYQ